MQPLLVLNDLTWGQRQLRKALPGRAEVLLYTFNKARDIDQTLESVFASDLGGARVTVLDNGSTDKDPGRAQRLERAARPGAPGRGQPAGERGGPRRPATGL